MLKNKALRSLVITLSVILAFIVIIGVVFAIQTATNKLSIKLTKEQAQEIVDDTIDYLPNVVSPGAVYVADNTEVTVNNVSYGTDKNIILDCTYTTVNVGGIIESNLDKYLVKIYEYYLEREVLNKKTNATSIKLFLSDEFKADIEKAEVVTGDVTISLYEVKNGKPSMYYEEDLINKIFGGFIDAKNLIDNANTVMYNGEEVSIASLNTIRTGIKDCFKLKNYDAKKPDTSIPLVRLWNSIKFDFYRNFIEKARWQYLTDGLVTTLQITALAVLLGIVIGFVVAIIRVTNHKTGKLSIASGICKVYLSVMRGTPVMVQLLIFFFVILSPLGVDKFPAAVVCFGLNSGAYVSEIVRGGIVSIDEGQMEAGRSLGFNYIQTMFYIVLPQAFKAVLPALANEFITLLKESSIAFYIGVADLTSGGNRIRAVTYSNFMPLIAIAVIYLILVLGLTKCVSILERRLQKGDKG